jgi:hypothetical protein
MSVNIICFLTVKPCELFYDFCKKLKSKDTEIYICIDDNDYTIPNYDNEINIIQIDNQICENSGFKSTVLLFNNKACSRDKALYFFCKNNIDYNHIWFIEEDVFIPSIHTIENINNKYIVGDLLVCSNNIEYTTKTNSWHWNRINKQIKIPPPYASSMICAIRCSKQLLTHINEYVNKYNNLFMDEVLFNTIALQNNLNIVTIEELSTIVYRRVWVKNNIKITHLYHPIKSIKKQYEIRSYIDSCNTTI